MAEIENIVRQLECQHTQEYASDRLFIPLANQLEIYVSGSLVSMIVPKGFYIC